MKQCVHAFCGVSITLAALIAASDNAFAQANAFKPTPANAFNLGTAQLANGKREEGSATLAHAMNDRALRADALYNRGNSALAANAYDYAIRDYIETLKLRPIDAKAKRNLEIALQKKQAMQQARGGNQKWLVTPAGSSSAPAILRRRSTSRAWPGSMPPA